MKHFVEKPKMFWMWIVLIIVCMIDFKYNTTSEGKITGRLNWEGSGFTIVLGLGFMITFAIKLFNRIQEILLLKKYIDTPVSTPYDNLPKLLFLPIIINYSAVGDYLSKDVIRNLPKNAGSDCFRWIFEWAPRQSNLNIFLTFLVFLYVYRIHELLIKIRDKKI